jgi:hypothetical protein
MPDVGNTDTWRSKWFAVDPPRSEVDAMAGRAVLNNFRSEGSFAQALSVRTKISAHFAGSLTYTVAQNVPLAWHSGAAVQLWAETPLTSAFSVGAGVGVFITAYNRAPSRRIRRPIRQGSWESRWPIRSAADGSHERSGTGSRPATMTTVISSSLAWDTDFERSAPRTGRGGMSSPRSC